MLRINGKKFDDNYILNNFDIVSQFITNSRTEDGGWTKYNIVSEPFGDYEVSVGITQYQKIIFSNNGDSPSINPDATEYVRRYRICYTKDLNKEDDTSGSKLEIDNTSISKKIRLFSYFNTKTDQRLKCRLTVDRSVKNPGGMTQISKGAIDKLSIGIGCVVNGKERVYSAKQITIFDGYFTKTGAGITTGEYDGEPGNDGYIDISANHIDFVIPFETSCLKSEFDKGEICLIVKCKKLSPWVTLKVDINDIGTVGGDDNFDEGDEEKFINLAPNRVSGRYLQNFAFSAKQITTNIANVNIYRDCFRYFVDDYNYFNLDEQGYLTYNFMDGLYGIGTDDNGIWIKIGEEKMYVSDLNIALQTANEKVNEVKTDIENTNDNVVQLGSNMTIINNDLYGEGGTSLKPTTSGVLSRTRSIESNLFGEGGSYIDPLPNSTLAVLNSTSKNATDALSNANSAQTLARSAETLATAAQSTADAAQATIDALSISTPKTFNFANIFKENSKFNLYYFEHGSSIKTILGNYSNIPTNAGHFTTPIGSNEIKFSKLSITQGSSIYFKAESFTFDNVEYYIEPIDNISYFNKKTDPSDNNSKREILSGVYGYIGTFASAGTNKSLSTKVRITNTNTGANIIVTLKITIGNITN